MSSRLKNGMICATAFPFEVVIEKLDRQYRSKSNQLLPITIERYIARTLSKSDIGILLETMSDT